MTRIGFLSTYPPQMCGIANFTTALRTALPPLAAGAVVAAVDPAGPGVGAATWPPEVRGVLEPDSPASCLAAARILNQEDVAILQHEFGIYGGPNGVDALRVIDLLTVPAIVVVHTVPADPTHHQRAVIDRILAKAAAVVAMSQDARHRLSAQYGIPGERIRLIPHGVAPKLVGVRHAHEPAAHRTGQTAPTLLTWGLLRPDKGIEWALAALPLLRGNAARAGYVIAGRTHPRILEHQGESYRHQLAAQADQLGVADRVTFDDRFLTPDELQSRLKHTSCVVLPYDTPDQATSGVLTEAVAAGIPVVATRFPHAVELLTAGRGIVVPHRDPQAMADAITALLKNPKPGPAQAHPLASEDLSWHTVAACYHRLAAEVMTMPAAPAARTDRPRPTAAAAAASRGAAGPRGSVPG
ncbi:glycosyltransferase [Streptomyces sp. NPDC001093]|uniref:glycosyltransferase n=1 Tax=Streptomyces sp. NPDC001093 TaxID=3154376 RepID=UPI003326F42F